VDRIDPRTGKSTARIAVGYEPLGIAADDTAVWVTNGPGCGDAGPCGSRNFPQQNSVMRIDPRTNRVVANIRVLQPYAVTLGFGSVWVTGDGSGSGTVLVRIDPRSNRVVSTTRLSRSVAGYANLTTAGRFVWVTVPAKNGTFQIVRVDPSTDAVTLLATVQGAGVAADIAGGPGAVWVTQPQTTSPSGLARLDPSTGRVVARITLPDAAPVGLDAVTTGGGYVWATSVRGYFWKVDPATNRRVGAPIQLGAAPPVAAPDVLVAYGSVWAAVDDGHIWQLAP
jgi:streptogramin lyase